MINHDQAIQGQYTTRYKKQVLACVAHVDPRLSELAMWLGDVRKVSSRSQSSRGQMPVMLVTRAAVRGLPGPFPCLL